MNASQNRRTSQSDDQELMSLGDLLREGWQGRRFFKIVNNNNMAKSKASDAQSEHTALDKRDILLEICIKPREFCDMDCKLLIVRNISHVARQEKLQSEYEY